MTREELLKTYGAIYKRYEDGIHYIRTEDRGNFLWSHPAWKEGNNVIAHTNIRFKEWIADNPHAHYMGEQTIVDYCGIDVIWRKE